VNDLKIGGVYNLRTNYSFF